MIDDIIIVAGARRLADREDSREWARVIIAREIAGATRAVAGDARGPDEWTHELAAAQQTPSERWRVPGTIDFYDGRGPLDFVHVAGWSDASTTADPRKRPLARNAAMIAAHDPFRTHATARLVALYHPESTTRSAHTR